MFRQASFISQKYLGPDWVGAPGAMQRLAVVVHSHCTFIAYSCPNFKKITLYGHKSRYNIKSKSIGLKH